MRGLLRVGACVVVSAAAGAWVACGSGGGAAPPGIGVADGSTGDAGGGVGGEGGGDDSGHPAGDDAGHPAGDGGGPDGGKDAALSDAGDGGGGFHQDAAGPPPAGFTFTEIGAAAGVHPIAGCSPGWSFDIAVESFFTPGKLDIFAGDHLGNNCMARNNGDGTFANVPGFSTSVGTWSVQANDFDDDGRIDLAVNWDSADNTLFHDVGGSLSPLTGSALPLTNACNGMAWNDVDGDGRPDVAMTGFNGQQGLQLGTSSGKMSDVTSSNAQVSLGRALMSVQLADLDGDSWPDLLLQPYQSPTGNGGSGVFDPAATHQTLVLFNRAAGPGQSPVFAAARSVGLDDAPGGGVSLGDYDNDGALDVLAVGTSAAASATPGVATYEAKLFHNDGHGSFTDVTTAAGLPPDTTLNPYTVVYLHSAFVDADDDGFLDLFWADPGGQHLLRNLGTGKFADVTATTKLDGAVSGDRPVRLYVADVNDDGADDLLVQRSSSGAPNSISLFHNDIGGTHWIKVRLVGAGVKTALGSRILIYEAGHLGEAAFLRGSRQVLQGTSHRHPLEQTFGVADGATYDIRTVFWPSKKVVDTAGVVPGKSVTIHE